MVTLPPPTSRTQRLSTLQSWQRRTSITARWALLAYALVIIYASLHPFSGWVDSGVAPWAYVNAPWPRYWTWFDLVTNGVAYIPLGALLAWALYPRWCHAWAWVVATLAAAFLSALLEGLQTYLPYRISSNVDWLCNILGGFVGAVIGSMTASPFIDKGRLREWRLRWFEREASAGLVLVAAWFAAQLHPQALAFGTGEIVAPFQRLWAEVSNQPVMPWISTPLSVEQHWMAETLAATSAFGGAALFFVTLMRPLAPRVRLLLAFGLGAVLMKSLGAAALVDIEAVGAWLTPGAQMGAALGSILALAGCFTPYRVQRALAILGLVAGLIIVNALPDNPYYTASLAQWQQGAWVNFNGLLNMLAMTWPLMALVYMWRRV